MVHREWDEKFLIDSFLTTGGDGGLLMGVVQKLCHSPVGWAKVAAGVAEVAMGVAKVARGVAKVAAGAAKVAAGAAKVAAGVAGSSGNHP